MIVMNMLARIRPSIMVIALPIMGRNAKKLSMHHVHA